MVKKTAGGVLLPGKNDNELQAPPIKAVHPAGSAILVEMLSGEEVLNTKLALKEGAKVGNEQAYIVEFGPCVKQDEVNLKVGDRVLLSGKPMELPETKMFAKRKLALVEVHNVKAVFEEDK